MNQQLRTSLLTSALFLLLFSFLSAEAVNIEVKEHTLANGMKFLVVENHDAPVFSTQIRVNAGGLDEKLGYTGISHFLEHMMFKGTEIFGTSNYAEEARLMDQIDSIGVLLLEEWYIIHDPMNYPPDSTLYKKYRQDIADIQDIQKNYVIKDELWETYLQNGGSGLNASTSEEGTQYYVSLPANKLELWFLMESDRFKNTIFREFYSERDVVYEERRMRTEDSYWGKMKEQFEAAAFTAQSYNHPVVGWAADVETWDHDLLKKYYHTYYVPNNTYAAIVGDVNAEEVFALAEKYFGNWEQGPEIRRQVTFEPPQIGERRIEVEYDANPMLMIGYHMPASGHPDVVVLDLISDLLSRGRTSRLNKSIVDDQKLASYVSAGISYARYPTLFTVMGAPLPGKSLDELEQSIYAELDKLKNEPISDWEMEKIHNQYDANMIRSVNSNRGLCWRLLQNEIVNGNWTYMNDYWEAYKAVTPEDIMRVAKQYLNKSNRTVAWLVKPEVGDEVVSDASMQMEGGK